jgi:hypothetical protein
MRSRIRQERRINRVSRNRGGREVVSTRLGASATGVPAFRWCHECTELSPLQRVPAGEAGTRRLVPISRCGERDGPRGPQRRTDSGRSLHLRSDQWPNWACRRAPWKGRYCSNAGWLSAGLHGHCIRLRKFLLGLARAKTCGNKTAAFGVPTIDRLTVRLTSTA